MKKLTEMCDIKYGYAFDSKCFTEDSSYPQLARIRDVKRGYSETYYSGEYPEDCVLSAGDLLVGMDGEFNIARWKCSGALLNQRVCKLIAKDGTNEEYLRFAMTKALKEIEQKTAFVTVKHLSAKELNKLQLFAPEKSEQENIAGILTTLEEIIESRKQELQKMDELIKARFVEMFGDCNNWTSLDELTEKITDGSHNPPKGVEKSEYLMLSSQNVFNDLILDDVRYLTKDDFEKENRRTDIEEGDVLLTIVGTVGRTHVVRNGEKYVFQRSVGVIKPIKGCLDGTFLSAYIGTPKAKEQLESGAHGSSQKGIYLKDIKKLTIPVVDYERQIEFTDFVKQVDKSKVVA